MGGSRCCGWPQIVVPNGKVGLIIGKMGATIKGIQDRSGAHIQVPREPDATNPAQRTIDIEAPSQASADAAKAEIEALLAADAERRGMGMGGMGMGGMVREPRRVTVILAHHTLVLASHRAHVAVVFAFRRRRCHREVLPSTCPSRTSVYVPVPAHSHRMPAARVLTMCLLHDAQAGLIIGRRGATISDMQYRTRTSRCVRQPPSAALLPLRADRDVACVLETRIQVPPQPDAGSNPATRTIEVTGPPQGCEAARMEIENLVATHHANQQGMAGGYGMQPGYGQPYGAYGAYGMQPQQMQPYGAYGAYGMQHAQYDTTRRLVAIAYCCVRLTLCAMQVRPTTATAPAARCCRRWRRSLWRACRLWCDCCGHSNLRRRHRHVRGCRGWICDHHHRCRWWCGRNQRGGAIGSLAEVLRGAGLPDAQAVRYETRKPSANNSPKGR